MGRLDGAVYGTLSAGGPRVDLTSGPADAIAGLLGVLARGDPGLEGGRLDAGDGTSEVVVIPLAAGDEDDVVFVAATCQPICCLCVR